MPAITFSLKASSGLWASPAFITILIALPLFRNTKVNADLPWSLKIKLPFPKVQPVITCMPSTLQESVSTRTTISSSDARSDASFSKAIVLALTPYARPGHECP